MSDQYPNKCCQCGFCCLAENCIIARHIYGIPKIGVLCPALSFDMEGLACCNLIEQVSNANLGIGVGCCIKARAYIRGVEYDFASLPDAAKHAAKLFRLNA